ncbi:MAG TPA: FlgD immunoglobulin-like domain containing protein, partial [Terriglobales bacterium]|nr:FlgD immunoglobulin-like domain containing protein [Terriglobales bacterium]
LFEAPFYDDREASNLDDPYQSWVEESVSDLVAQALGDLGEVDVATGVTKILDMPWNRRSNTNIDQLTTDCDEQVIKFRGRDDLKLRAELVNFAVHPVIMSQKTGAIDADFPGYLASRLEADGDNPDLVALFLNGGAGDIVPQHGTETDSSEVAQDYGEDLAAGAESVANVYVPTDGMQVSVERQVRTFTQGITSCSSCANDPPRQNLLPTSLDLESTIAVVGKPGDPPALAFMTIPGEPFVRLQIRLREQSAVERTMLLGYTNGYLGYFADNSARTDGYSPYGVVACHGPTYFNNFMSSTPGEALVTAGLEAIERLDPVSAPTSVSPRAELPVTFGLRPNPSRIMQLAFSLPAACEAELSIFDVAGHRVRTLASGRFAPGAYARTWDGRDGRGKPAPAGVYFCRLRAGSTIRSIRGVHLR